MKVEFITRENCSLCDQAERLLAGWAGEFALDVDVVDVDQDQALYDLFNERVPVLRNGAGEVLAEGRWAAEPPGGLFNEA